MRRLLIVLGITAGLAGIAYAYFGDIPTTANIWNDPATNRTMFWGQHLSEAFEFSTGGANPPVEIDWADGNNQVITLGHTGTATITFINSAPGAKYSLEFIQDGSGSRVVDYAMSGVKWPGGVTPTQTTTAGKKDVLTFTYDGEYLGVARLNL